MVNKVLFILKRREDFNSEEHKKKSIQTGLYNSANYTNKMLNDIGITSNIEIAIDNNCIDRLVTLYKPTHVIIEALWVVPTKFIILCQLHPDVKWIIRLHSDMPFIACEGIAFTWISKYSIFKNIIIGINSPKLLREMKFYLKLKNGFNDDDLNKKVVYLPNYYSIDTLKIKTIDKTKDDINICCFGAIRPLKNHLIQAYAAIEFAKKIGKKLKFHINSTRIEGNGQPIYHNIKALFSELQNPDFELVEHPWHDKENFLNLCSKMDIGLQVSFSETFNIVGCDIISQGVPLIGSSEIPWSCQKYNASTIDSEDIVNKLLLLYLYDNSEDNVKLNTKCLLDYVNNTKKIWSEYFTNHL